MIIVEKYNAKWPLWFQELKDEIWPLIENFSLGFEHVGSTSVPGLAAKPIIDIDIIIKNENVLPQIIEALALLGYKHLGNRGIEGREAFLSTHQKINHNLYVCQEDCLALKNHLALRNHLRSSQKSLEEYSVLKQQLASEFPDSIEHYVSGKTEFIIGIISQYGLSKFELNSISQANKAPAIKK